MVQLATPVAYFLKLVGTTIAAPVPKHLVETLGASWAAPEHLVANGPYRLESCQPGVATVLVRHDGGCGPFYSNVMRVEYIHGVKDWTSALQLYQEDRLDFLANWLASPEQYQAALASHADECEEHGIDQTNVLVLDVNQPPFDDVRVRCALAHAIDKQQLVKDIKSINLAADGGFVPPGIPGHAPGIGLAYRSRSGPPVAQRGRLWAEPGVSVRATDYLFQWEVLWRPL